MDYGIILDGILGYGNTMSCVSRCILGDYGPVGQNFLEIPPFPLFFFIFPFVICALSSFSCAYSAAVGLFSKQPHLFLSFPLHMDLATNGSLPTPVWQHWRSSVCISIFLVLPRHSHWVSVTGLEVFCPKSTILLYALVNLCYFFPFSCLSALD